MNKIINVNLAGQAIAIDELAYSSLKTYFSSLEKHFKNTDSGSEILEDIEARIAEMFQSKIKSGSGFIDQKAVDEAIGVMGSPSDMGIEEDNSDDDSRESYQNLNSSKKLFRDGDDKVLGGVSSGLAAYFDLDVSIVRLIFIASVIFAGFGVLPYIILWAVLPEAKTPHDRFRMRGETPDIDGIAKKIRKEAENVAQNIKKNDKLKSTAKGIGDVLTNIVRAFGKLFGGAALVALVIAGTVLAASFYFGMNDMQISMADQELFIPQLFESPLLSKLFYFCAFSLVIIPILSLIYMLVAFVFNFAIHRFTLKAILIIWLWCLAILIGVSIYGADQIHLDEFDEFKIEYHQGNRV